MIPKKNIVVFNDRIIELLLQHSAYKTGERSYVLELEKGTIYIALAEPSRTNYLYTVFMRFATPQPNLGNKHSGKCNFHLSEPVSAFKAFESFQNIHFNTLIQTLCN